jgi:Ca2+/H+ antiporter
VLNGVVGLVLLLGGLRHHEQSYNLQGAAAYLGVIIPLSVIALILPNFTQAVPGRQSYPRASGFLLLFPDLFAAQRSRRIAASRVISCSFPGCVIRFAGLHRIYPDA